MDYAGNGWAYSPIWEFINEGLASKADNKLIKRGRETLKIMLPNEQCWGEQVRSRRVGVMGVFDTMVLADHWL